MRDSREMRAEYIDCAARQVKGPRGCFARLTAAASAERARADAAAANIERSVAEAFAAADRCSAGYREALSHALRLQSDAALGAPLPLVPACRPGGQNETSGAAVRRCRLISG